MLVRKLGQQLNVTVPFGGTLTSNWFNVTGAEEIIFVVWGGSAADDPLDILSFGWSVDGAITATNGLPAAGTSSPAAASVFLGLSFATKSEAAIIRVLRVVNSSCAAIAPFISLNLSMTTANQNGVNIECYGVFSGHGAPGHVMG